jgi:hypothetical protein
MKPSDVPLRCKRPRHQWRGDSGAAQKGEKRGKVKKWKKS